MPSLKLFISDQLENTEGLVARVFERFATMPDCENAVLVVLESRVFCGDNASPFWLEVRASRETPAETVVEIANHFLNLIDVEVFHPTTGSFVFVEKGQRLTNLERSAGAVDPPTLHRLQDVRWWSMDTSRLTLTAGWGNRSGRSTAGFPFYRAR